MRMTFLRAALTAFVCVLAPAPASADFLVSPYFGWSRNADTERWVPGGGATAEITIGSFVVGGDVGYAAGFFDPEDDVFDLIASSHVLTVTGHAGAMFFADDDNARVLPYVTAGLGWMRQQARDREGLASASRSDPSFHFGGGVNVMATEYLGVRIDVRNFRSLRDPFESPDPLVEDLGRVSFWRFTLGAVIRFGTD
jgi:opacity protein-like surface antigen